ncbi:MAG: recombinase family protein [Pseudomonadota bacterium]
MNPETDTNTSNIMATLAKADAVIYSRVSTRHQLEDGHGLGGQEYNCREYARRRNYRVIKTFQERAQSGGTLHRPSFEALLEFVRAHGSEGMVVILDDISRFARDIKFHWELRDELKATGGKLESPTLKFGEDADSVLVENLLASVSQHQRQKGRRTHQK